MSRQPFYVDVTNELRRRIEAGEYPVGGRLPTENALTDEFDVSRSTIRQALAALEEAGLIDRRQGSGTRVLARTAPVRYVQTVASEADVLRYASETVLDFLGPPAPVPVGEARRLHLGDPEPWVRLRGIRRSVQAAPPLGLSTIFLRAEHAKAITQRGMRSQRALFVTLSEAFGLTVTHVDQEITATLLAPDEADLLDAATGAPALAVVRRYFSEEAGLFQIAESVHPADRFSYAVRLERERSPLPSR
jgi:GntR family transcriptional regulator